MKRNEKKNIKTNKKKIEIKINEVKMKGVGH